MWNDHLAPYCLQNGIFFVGGALCPWRIHNTAIEVTVVRTAEGSLSSLDLASRHHHGDEGGGAVYDVWKIILGCWGPWRVIGISLDHLFLGKNAFCTGSPGWLHEFKMSACRWGWVQVMYENRKELTPIQPRSRLPFIFEAPTIPVNCNLCYTLTCTHDTHE